MPFQALHRVRERLVKARTARINEIRGLLSEYGIILPQGVTKFRHGLLPRLEQEQAKLTALGREIFRPASPNPALRHGLRGRGSREEEGRIWHPGPKAMIGLHLTGRIYDGICTSSCTAA
jgi:hypothetical protein